MWRKHHMKRKWLCTLCIIFLLLGMELWNNPKAEASAKAGEKGMVLDAARTFYSPKIIKRYIRTLAKNHASFLELHLTDNERFGVENNYLGQTIKNATVKNGSYYNKKTGKAFLSKQQLADLINYADQRHIELIPEIDMPGHDNGILRLLSYSKAGRKLKKKVEIVGGNNEMKYNKAATLQLTKRILSEYLPLLKTGNHIGIGADEVSIDTKHEENVFANYLNSVDTYVNKHGLKLMAWNDGFHKRIISKIPNNILVFYWSRDGEVDSKSLRKKLRRLRATLPQLMKHHFKVINANFYCLYVINERDMYTKKSRSFWLKTLKKWHANVWDDNNLSNVYRGKKKIGVALSIWGVHPQVYNDVASYKLSQKYLNAFLKHK